MKLFLKNYLIIDFLERLLAFVGIIILLPVFLLIGFLVFSFDDGTILFSQKRVGLNGKIFKLYKFKTMIINKDKTQITAEDDPRITTLGKILRKFKLDELPQLFNILIGDISFVGYRPEVPMYVDMNNKSFIEVLSFKPGITSPVTLEFRNEEQLIQNCKIDKELFYRDFILPYKLYQASKFNKERTIVKDFIVILKTILYSIFPRLSSNIDEIKLSRFKKQFEKG